MVEAEIQKFVDAFASAWARRDGDAFLRLWHPDGQLHYPFANRTIYGREMGMLTQVQNKGAPKLTWKLLGWTARDNVVVIEWECTNSYDEQILSWRGVDRITLENGRIREEVVYSDTAALQARRLGIIFPPLLQLPD